MAEISRDRLMNKVGALRAQRDQAIANANACGGAIAALEELVAELDRPAPVAEATQDTGTPLGAREGDPTHGR